MSPYDLIKLLLFMPCLNLINCEEFAEFETHFERQAIQAITSDLNKQRTLSRDFKVYTQAVSQYHMYCDLHPTNLPCKTKCQRESSCGVIPSRYRDMSPSSRSSIVGWVNIMRTQIARGKHVDFPKASNMRVISYDLECEFFAACFLKTCYHRDTFVKIALDGSHLGATGYGIVSFNATRGRIGSFEIRDAFKGWFNGSGGQSQSQYSKSYAGDLLFMSNLPDDFMQIAAASTTYIGCATYEKNMSSNLIFYQFYCVYKPAVRYSDKVLLYRMGKPASGCSDWHAFPNSNFPELCGKIRRLEGDLFTPFKDMNCAWLVKVGYVYIVTLLCIIFSCNTLI